MVEKKTRFWFPGEHQQKTDVDAMEQLPSHHDVFLGVGTMILVAGATDLLVTAAPTLLVSGPAGFPVGQALLPPETRETAWKKKVSFPAGLHSSPKKSPLKTSKLTDFPMIFVTCMSDPIFS